MFYIGKVVARGRHQHWVFALRAEDEEEALRKIREAIGPHAEEDCYVGLCPVQDQVVRIDDPAAGFVAPYGLWSLKPEVSVTRDKGACCAPA